MSFHLNLFQLTSLISCHKVTLCSVLFKAPPPLLSFPIPPNLVFSFKTSFVSFSLIFLRVPCPFYLFFCLMFTNLSSICVVYIQMVPFPLFFFYSFAPSPPPPTQWVILRKPLITIKMYPFKTKQNPKFQSLFITFVKHYFSALHFRNKRTSNLLSEFGTLIDI